MFRINAIRLVLLVLSFSQFCYASENTAPSKATPDKQITSNQLWWPERLDLAPLRQHSAESNPMGKNFTYATEFKKLNLKAVKEDIKKLMTTSQDWWRGGTELSERAFIALSCSWYTNSKPSFLGAG